MAQIILTVGASADDISLWQAGSDFATQVAQTSLAVGSDSLTDGCSPGIRFTNVAIPKGSTIVSVTIRLWKNGTEFKTVSERWAFTAEDNAAVFTELNVPGQRAITTNVAADLNQNFNETDGTAFDKPRTASLRTGALRAALQEIIDRPGWAFGNAICLVCNSAADGSRITTAGANKSFYSWDSAVAGTEPQLIVDFIPAADSPQIQPSERPFNMIRGRM